MKKDIAAEFRKVAAVLPVTTHEVFEVRSGQALIEMCKAQGIDHSEYKEHETYKVGILKEVNHAKRMKRIYTNKGKDGGIEGVKKYLKDLEQFLGVNLPDIQIPEFRI